MNLLTALKRHMYGMPRRSTGLHSGAATCHQQPHLATAALAPRALRILSLVPGFPPPRHPYLSDPTIPHKHRTALVRLRCGNHWLASHTSR